VGADLDVLVHFDEIERDQAAICNRRQRLAKDADPYLIRWEQCTAARMRSCPAMLCIADTTEPGLQRSSFH
jgi:hypothetical protein